MEVWNYPIDMIATIANDLQRYSEQLIRDGIRSYSDVQTMLPVGQDRVIVFESSTWPSLLVGM